MKKIINSCVIVYAFLLPLTVYSMQRAAQSIKSIKPKAIKPKSPTLPSIQTPTKLVIAPIKTPKAPSSGEKINSRLPSQPTKFSLPKEFSAGSSWAAVDLLDPTPTHIIEALNNHTQPTTDSFNAMIEAQKANKFRVGFATNELIEAMGEQAEVLFPKDQPEWFTLKNESGETIFESHPLPEGYMFLKKLGKDSELLILGEQTSSLKNSREKLHIPTDLQSKFLQTSAETFNKFFNTELTQAKRMQSAIAEKELADTQEKGLVVNSNEPPLPRDSTPPLLAQKDTDLFTEMAESGLYNGSSYLKNNQEKLARLRSIPANAESAENFFEQLQENFEKKKAKAAKKSAKIAAQEAKKVERAQLEENRLAQEQAELQRNTQAEALEHKKHESQQKIANLAKEIQDAQEILKQEIIIKNQLDAQAQLQAQEEFLQRQIDADYEQFLEESTEIETQELLAQKNQNEQEQVTLQIIQDEAALEHINQEISAIKEARENLSTIKQQELHAADAQYDRALESEKQAILQRLQNSQDQLHRTQEFNNASHATQLQKLDLLEKNAREKLEQEKNLIAQQKKQTQETITQNRDAEEARLENEEKELKRQQDNLQKITAQKAASQHAIKEAQQESIQAQLNLLTAQQDEARALYNLEQARQERIATESRHSAQAVLNYGEKLPTPDIPSHESHQKTSLQPIAPKAIIFDDTPEEKPLTGIVKFKPENNQEAHAVPAYTIPELLSTTPIDKPTVEEFIPETEENNGVTVPQRPAPSSSTTETIPTPSYNNSVQAPWHSKSSPSRPITTDTTYPSTAVHVAPAHQQQAPGSIQNVAMPSTHLPQGVGTVRNQGLSIPSFNQKYGQQITHPAGVAVRPVNTTTGSNSAGSNTSPYYNHTESKTSSQQPELNWPADRVYSAKASKTTVPSLNAAMNPQSSDSKTEQKEDTIPHSSLHSSDEEYVQNHTAAPTPHRLGEKTITNNLSRGQKRTPAEFAQKPVHWLWKLIAFIINFIKKLLHIS